MNQINTDKSKEIEQNIKQLLTLLGTDTDREGLKETPKRVAQTFQKICEGYNRNFKDEITVFDNESNYDGIILSGKIDFFSTCEHHLLPFYGYAYIGYIPESKIIGLSKLSRVVDIHSRRLQDQERISVHVADELMDVLNPKGVAIILVAKHFCNAARGVEKKESVMKTMLFRGEFKESEHLQNKFLSLVGDQSL